MSKTLLKCFDRCIYLDLFKWDGSAEFGNRVVGGFSGFDENSDGTIGSEYTGTAGHGTHITGTVGGAFGIAKNVTLVSVEIFSCLNGGGSSAGLIAGIDWIRHNATLPAVANISLALLQSPAFDAAVNSLLDAGVHISTSAGNGNRDAYSQLPARVPRAITVASSTESDARAGSSNWGPCVDISELITTNCLRHASGYTDSYADW